MTDAPGPEELLRPGHLACQGCAAALAMRYVLGALGERTVVVLPASCWSIIAGPFPSSSLAVPLVHVPFETAGAVASGVRAALDVRGRRDVEVLAWAGDGGTFDIGLQALSGAAERNEDIIYACYDNEAYMNTGIQRSSATPRYAWTTTTPATSPKTTPKKNIMEILAAHKIPYCATATVAYPQDLADKVAKARKYRGTKFLHILCPCPPGWKYEPRFTVKLARLAVHTKVFPIYEITGGDTYRINIDPEGTPVAEYLKLQGRFAHLNETEMEEMQARVDFEWGRLLHKSLMEPFTRQQR